MRLYFIVLLTAAAFLATTKVAAATEAPRTSTLVSPAVVPSKNAAQGGLIARKRRLRSNKAASEDAISTEERGITVTGIENLVKSSSKKAQLKLWLTQKKSTDATFKLLNLERRRNFIFGSKEFLTWANYVTKLKKEDASAAMIDTLLKHYDEGILARLIAGTKTSNAPMMKKTCDRLAGGAVYEMDDSWETSNCC
ncbi:hypothetical protein PC129_g1127 [Phytophthora cactorum]|uniref:RxLR effector protein n=1 Tax=Phytophthora cactorum TaxID=29920 RepID=A0A329SWQ4_9STRA|nr:hypothetical protein Pcac1_g4586 [Phytophthora cactorum]KAG2844656.1 hypothetical protein PC112_g2140 [Phytophthora cactorum]KAG2845297.1 hypothetical protein PC111_g1616 [Phytophthora cactorum]KAG2867024.1 hypothetical protein PC113_g2311 [Phytophthora cactorum]KAG2930500.1 hypothetical protein PC114_g2455 [Phytophthora cactorum]